MGMRSEGGAASTVRPPLLLAAAVVLAVEAAALLVYTAVNVVDIATNNSYQVSNGVALVIMQAIMIAGIALIASGVAKVRPWTRTPAVMVQVLAGIVAVVLLQAHRYDWGVLVLLLAVAGLAGLLAPASLKALARPLPGPARPDPAGGKPAAGKSASGKSSTGKSASGTSGAANPAANKKPGNPAKSGNPAKRNPAGNPVSRQS